LIRATLAKGRDRDGQPEIGPLPVLFLGIPPASNFAGVHEVFSQEFGFHEKRVGRENAKNEAARLFMGSCGFA
jgi:hypothetical protein